MALPLVALAGAQLAMSVIQGNQASDAQNAFSEQNANNAIEAQTNSNRAINRRLLQEQEVAGDKKRRLLVQMIEAQSTRAATGKTTSGNTIDRLSRSINNQVGQAIEDINYNLSGALLNAEDEKLGVSSRTQSRINSVPRTSYDPTFDLIKGGLNIYSASQVETGAVP